MANLSRRSTLLLLLGACGVPRLDAPKDGGKLDDARAPDDAPSASDAVVAADARDADARAADARAADARAADARAIDAAPDAPAVDAAPDAPPIDAAPASCTANGTAVIISANHGHTLVVSKADVIAGVDKTYDIRGSATHAHSATVMAAQFAQLQADMSASLTSTINSSHSHPISISCL
jgi:hypothetical protein